MPECYGRIFNLGSDQAYSLLDYCQILGRLCQVEHETVPFPADRKLIDIGDYYGSYERFRRLTAWVPQVDLVEGLERSVHFFREHRDNYVR